ncbi:MAG: BrnA antitoxin family protein [Thermosynechococcaceae cyanobacterium]
MRLDADLLEWFKNHHLPDKGYQASINGALREYVA